MLAIAFELPCLAMQACEVHLALSPSGWHSSDCSAVLGHPVRRRPAVQWCGVVMCDVTACLHVCVAKKRAVLRHSSRRGKRDVMREMRCERGEGEG
eukprot:684003-Rhodomonas_salina.2